MLNPFLHGNPSKGHIKVVSQVVITGKSSGTHEITLSA